MGNIIQQFSQNHLGGINRMEYNYRFNGEVLKMRTTHKKTGVADIVEISEYDYDHFGRKTKFKHSLNGIQKTIASYTYDATGRMIQKQYSPSSAIGSFQTGLWTNNIHSIDRFAEKFSDISTYQFASNDPIGKIELDGLEGVSVTKGTKNLIFIIQGKASVNNDRATAGHTQVDNILTDGGKQFSIRDTGLGAINEKDFPANSQVITYTGTDSNLTPNDIVSTAYDFHKKNPKGKIFMVGHSQGAENIERVSNTLNQYGVPIQLAITLDPASTSERGEDNLTISSNVKNVVNISAKGSTDFFNASGAKVSASNPNKTKVINYTASSKVNHTNIDNTFSPEIIKIINNFLNTGTASETLIITPHKDNEDKKGGSSKY